MPSLKSFSPVGTIYQAIGLFVFVVVIVAVAQKFGVQAKANKIVGA